MYILFTLDSAFKQQRLPAWQPILTAGTVLPTFFVIGIAFIPVGIALLYFSDEVKENIIDYTFCNRSVLINGVRKNTGQTCLDFINEQTDIMCECAIPFELEVDFIVSFSNIMLCIFITLVVALYYFK